MIKIMRPKFFIPLHGQFSMLVKHCELAEKSGVAKHNAIPVETGKIVYLTPQKMRLGQDKIQANYVMVDGLGIGDVGEVVLRDRQQLAQDGMFVIIAAVDRKAGKVQAREHSRNPTAHPHQSMPASLWHPRPVRL